MGTDKKNKGFFLCSPASIKEKIGFLIAIYKPTKRLENSFFVRKPEEDYFE